MHIGLLKKDKELTKSINKNHPIYLNRLLRLGKPWEGLTWVIDLLPNYPKEVLKIIDSFFNIYCQYLPDDVMFGLSNIDQIIRAKYLNVDHPIEILHDLSPMEFECLIAELFSKMKYDVRLTKRTHDNGIDVIAKNSKTAKKELIMIQCKRHKQNIISRDIRDLAGVVEMNNATKGIFCTCGDYTKPAKKYLEKYNRIELLNGKDIIKLCNKHLGINWPIKIGVFSQKYQKGAYTNVNPQEH